MEFRNGMKCLVCEVGSIVKEKKDLDFEYKGVARTISNQKIFECPVCGEIFQNSKDQREVDRLLSDSRRQIDGLLTSDEIRKIRKQFGMTQIQFSEALKVGEKSFARYESGQIAQGRSMDNLLRILRNHPEAIREFDVNWLPKEYERVFREVINVSRKKRQKIKTKGIINDSESIGEANCAFSCR